MRRPLCRKQRWFHAVTMTCLAGFALSGCARGSRDVSKNLQESAEREAIEAERHVAERKKQESSSKSKEILGEEDFAERDEIAQAESRGEDPWKQTSLESESADEEAAEVADRDAIQTVSGSEVTEELLSQSEPNPVRELFDEQAEDLKFSTAATQSSEAEDQPEGSVRIRKVAEPAPVSAQSRNTRATAQAGQPSYRGAQEHPWARKAPPVQAAPTSEGLAQQRPGSVQKSAPSRSDTESQLSQSDVQVEAKARIEVLVTQARSLLEKGEYRSAYRAAQVAQRMAESNDVYFAAGEDQPADVVRSVLAKIRMEEAQLAQSSTSKSRVPTTKRPKPEASESTAKVATKTRKPANPFAEETEAPLSDAWKFAESQKGQQGSSRTDKQLSNPPNRVPPQLAGMQIRPKSSGDSQSKPFPSTSNWKEVREPQVAQSSASTADAAFGGVVPAAQPFDHGQLKVDSTPAAPSGRKLLVPRPFPKLSDDADDGAAIEPPELAVGADWRTESLNDAGSGRMPLLVAPAPPPEPTGEALSDLADDSLAVEAGEPTTPASQSRLWLMVAAVIGAFALLFVRRKPVPATAKKSA